MAHKPEELQEVLQYTFKNPALLRIAMTHTSYANESKVATTHNERLEFLGDSFKYILCHVPLTAGLSHRRLVSGSFRTLTGGFAAFCAIWLPD